MSMIKKTIQAILFIVLLATINIQTASAMSQGPLPPDESSNTPVAVRYVEGDIIFIQSQTTQAAALREATQSVWTHVGIIVKNKSKWAVAEAIGPLKMTPIADFIARSKNKSHKIMRFKHFDRKTMLKAFYKALPKYNKPYDIYFEFDQNRIYCSELTYLVFKEVTGFSYGRVQKMKDMRLDGPYAQALIKKRYTDTGREFDPEELIITPVSQVLDENSTLVYQK